MKCTDQHRFGKIMTSIRDQHPFEKGAYPKTLHEAYAILENHSLAKGSKSRDHGDRFIIGRGKGGRYG